MSPPRACLRSPAQHLPAPFVLVTLTSTPDKCLGYQRQKKSVLKDYLVQSTIIWSFRFIVHAKTHGQQHPLGKNRRMGKLLQSQFLLPNAFPVFLMLLVMTTANTIATIMSTMTMMKKQIHRFLRAERAELTALLV